jgi:phosphohistidine phosphatase
VRLLVVRHGVAMDREDFKGTDDDLRPLTEDGIRKMKKNAKGLSKIASAPSLLVTSPLKRAMQTSSIMRSVYIETEAVLCEALRPGTPPIAFAKWLGGYRYSLKAESIVTIVGHEPHLSTLIAWALESSAPKAFELKKGGACMLEFEGNDLAHGGAHLLWVATPALLRRMA